MQFAPIPPEKIRDNVTEIHRVSDALALPERVVNIENVRELTKEDVGQDARVVYDLAEVRRSHQAIARYVALGLRPFQIANLVGYSAGTIYQLQTSPMFQALVDEYSIEIDSGAVNMREVMLSIAADGLDKLGQRINASDADSEFIRRTTMDLLSRTGFGETVKTENKSIHAVLTAEDIAKIKQAAKDVP